jgi:DNA-binding LacI/PurR family transcriptional regulator
MIALARRAPNIGGHGLLSGRKGDVRRITMEDVAREAGVSRALVSLAYRGAVGVSERTRHRILETGRRLNYTPNRVAARLAEHGSSTFGVFLQDLHNDLFADIYDGLRGIADAENKHLVLAVGTADGQRDADALDTLQQSRVDVIIAAGLQLADEGVIDLNNRVPIVSVARHIPTVDSVVSDNYLGARSATQYLIGLGHRKIAFLANPPTDGYLDRRIGYEAAMAHAGLRSHVVLTTYSKSTAALDAGAILDNQNSPTAIFAHNDQAAFGVLEALAMRGLVAGRDVSVVGYDNSSVSRAPGTALTTVDIHSHSLGRSAALMALHRLSNIGGEAQIQTSVPSLVIRSTTGPNLSSE